MPASDLQWLGTASSVVIRRNHDQQSLSSRLIISTETLGMQSGLITAVLVTQIVSTPPEFRWVVEYARHILERVTARNKKATEESPERGMSTNTNTTASEDFEMGGVW